MTAYTRRVFYYETDQMGIMHHSNYIRWMEEGRLDYMRQLGLDYGRIEAAGIIMPVINVECKYLVSAHFDEQIYVTVTLTKFNGVRANFSYRLKNEVGVLLAEGTSAHCFLDEKTRSPLNLKRRLPEYCAELEKYIVEQR